MASIVSQRMTARPEGDFVVFLIGARINKLWRVHEWWPVARAMNRMIGELESQPDLGLLGYEAWGGRTTVMVQYWRSLEHLLRYAHATDAEHLPAWREFNRRLRAKKSTTVGIWHETYVVKAGAHESIYENMPPFGLGKVGPLVEARGRLNGAKERLAA